MAKVSAAQLPVPANLNDDEKRKAIPRLKKRVEELKVFHIDNITSRDDEAITSLQTNLEATFSTIFSPNTLEYRKYKSCWHLDTAAYYMGGHTPLHEVKESLKSNIKNAIATIESIILMFEEEIGEEFAISRDDKFKTIFNGLELHPEIKKAAGSLYADGHYSHAVQDAVKALNAWVHMRSQEFGADGTAMMQKVFSPNNPILAFNALVSPSDKDEQQGFMWLFSGAVMGIRNPRAHEFINDDPERALEFISFISLLAKIVDAAKKV